MAGRAQTIRVELDTDPATKNYTPMSNSDASAAMNARDQIVDRDLIPGWAVLEATVPAEWSALSAGEKVRYELLIATGEIKLSGANTRAWIVTMFGVGTQTRANFVALQDETTSRSEIIGVGKTTGTDIAEARGLV